MKLYSFLVMACIAAIGECFSQSVEALPLSKAIAEAVAHNPELAMRRHAVRMQQGAGLRTLAPAPPSVSVNYAFVPAGLGLRAFGERTVEISQTVEFPTTMYLRSRQASAEVTTAEAEWLAARSELSGRVASAYYTALAHKAKLKLAEENLALAVEFARTSGIRRSVGEGTRLEQLTSDVQKAQAANDLDAARALYAVSMNEMLALMGRSGERADAAVMLTDSLSYRAPPVAASRTNPSVLSSLHRREAASIGSTLAWTSWLPSLSASYFRQSRDGNSGFYGVSFGLSIPVWFFLDQRGRVEESSAALSIAESAYRVTVDSVARTVKNVMHEIAAAESQVKRCVNELAPQADEILRSAHLSFDAGEIGYLEFLAARQTFLQTRHASIDALLKYNIALVRLEQAIGYSIDESTGEGEVTR